MSNRKNNSKAISSTSNDAILEMAKGLHWLVDPTFKWNLYVKGGKQNMVHYAHQIVAALLSEDEELFEFFTAPSEAAPVWEPKERGERRRTKAQLKAVLGTSSSKIQLYRLGMLKAFYEGLRSAARGLDNTPRNQDIWFKREGEVISLLTLGESSKTPLVDAWALGYQSLAEVRESHRAIKDSWKKAASKKAEKAKAEKAKAEKVATKKVATKKAEPEAPPASGISYDILSAMIKEAVAEAVAEATKKAEPKAKAKKTASKKQIRQQLELAALEMAATQKTTRLRKKA